MNEKNLIQKVFRSPANGAFRRRRWGLPEEAPRIQAAEAAPWLRLQVPEQCPDQHVPIGRDQPDVLFLCLRAERKGEKTTLKKKQPAGGRLAKGTVGLLFLIHVLLFTAVSAQEQRAELLFGREDVGNSPEQLYFRQLLAPETVFGVVPGQKVIPPGIRYFKSPDSLRAWQNRGRDAFLKHCRQLDRFLTAAWPAKQSNAASRWQEADRAYRRFLAEHLRHPWIAVFRQYGAYRLLIHDGLPGDSAAEATTALVFYLQELLKAHSQNVILFHYGIAALKGRIPDIKRFQLARTMVRQLNREQVQERMDNVLAGLRETSPSSDQIRRQTAMWADSRKQLLAFVKGVQCGCSTGQ